MFEETGPNRNYKTNDTGIFSSEYMITFIIQYTRYYKTHGNAKQIYSYVKKQDLLRNNRKGLLLSFQRFQIYWYKNELAKIYTTICTFNYKDTSIILDVLPVSSGI